MSNSTSSCCLAGSTVKTLMSVRSLLSSEIVIMTGAPVVLLNFKQPPNDPAHQLRAKCPRVRILRSAVRHPAAPRNLGARRGRARQLHALVRRQLRPVSAAGPPPGYDEHG